MASAAKAGTTENEKTGLHVSNDGSQLAKGGSGKRKGRFPHFPRPARADRKLAVLFSAYSPHFCGE